MTTWIRMGVLGFAATLAWTAEPAHAQPATVRLVADLSPAVPLGAPINDRKIEVQALL